jgi:hypothetical protein
MPEFIKNNEFLMKSKEKEGLQLVGRNMVRQAHHELFRPTPSFISKPTAFIPTCSATSYPK